MTLLNKKGVSAINRHTNNINETEEEAFPMILKEYEQ